jgi:hypothetical protein
MGKIGQIELALLVSRILCPYVRCGPWRMCFEAFLAKSRLWSKEMKMVE